jgi:hypothetical protein
VGVALVASTLAGLGLYVGLWRYQPTAHRHVPDGTKAALRADAQQLLFFAPVRKHLWPVFLGSKSEEADDGPSRRERLSEATGTDIPADFREVVVASTDATSWVVMIGGTITAGGFVDGVEQVLAEEGNDDWSRRGALLIHRQGPALGQAEDGTVILGTRAAIVTAALPGRDDSDRLLPTAGAIAFTADTAAVGEMLGALPVRLPGTDGLAGIQRLTGQMTLSDNPTLEVALLPRQGVRATDLAADLDVLLARLKLATQLLDVDLYGASQAIGDSVIETEGDRVTWTAPWPYEALDRAAAQLAARLGNGRLTR